MRWLEYSSEDGYEYTETRCFYAVAIGRRTGVFTRLEEANQQVFGFPGFRMRKFNNYEDARDFLEEFEIYCDSLTEEGEEEEEEEEDEQEDDDIWFYAVAEGRSTGVFLAVEDARDQIFGFPGARMDAFLEYDDAVKYIERTIAIIREEKKRKEEEEKRRQVWFYAVAVGRSTGVFMDYQDAMEQIRGYSDFRMEKFLDFDEAQEYVAFNQVYSSDEESEEEEETWFYAVAVGRRVGIYTNHEAAKEQVLGYSGFRMKKFEDYEAAKEYMHNNQTFEEDEEKCEEAEEPAQQVEEETWYYAVAVGRIVGIYAYSENAIAQVHGYPGFRMRKFQHFADAQAYIESFQVCYSEEEEKNEEQEAEAEEVGTTWFYAVAVGRSIGIYTTYEEAIKQVHGYSGFRMKKFLDYDEAEDYLDFNRVYSSDGDEWANGSEDEIEPEEEEEIWHYAVAVGRRIGVYTDLEVAKAQVHRYSGFLMKKFLDYDEAAAYVEINKSENWGNNELPEEDEDEKWYYAVAVGRRTGVYSDREVAVDQVHGYSGFRMKKFLDYSEAHAYIKNNRAHHRGSIWGYNGVWA